MSTCKEPTPPATIDQLERLGWRELGGFHARRDHDGQVVLDGAIQNRRAKLVRSSDGSGGFVLMVEQQPQVGNGDRLGDRMPAIVAMPRIVPGWTESGQPGG